MFYLNKAAATQKKRFFYVPLIVASNLLSGCMTVDGMPSNETNLQSFTAYAENVFRRQNSATSQIMTLSQEEMDDPAQYEALLSVEKDMQSACELLNEYASRTQNGENTNVFFRSRVGSAVKNCDRATHKLEIMLKEFN